MKWKPYPAYKDSGVEWLGEVPTHWVIERFKRSVLYSRNGVWGDEALGDDNDIPCVRVADFDRQKLSVILDEPTIRNVLPKDRVGRQLNFGNLLLEKSGGGENQPVGCVVLYEDTKPAVCSNFVAKVELEDGMCPSFWRYMHATAYSIRLTVGSINQTSGIQNLDQGRYFDERACFPPASEQTAIATFLDRGTAKLDTLISKQEHLIELLQEKRQAIISHAVTKGLDPDVPMKDSGIEWLGEVPAHWDSVSLKWVATIFSGGTPDKSKTEYWEDGTIPWLNSGSVNQDLIIEPSEFITEDAFANSSAKWIPKNSLVIALAGQGKTKGMVAQLAIDTTCNQSMAAIIPNSKYEPRFLFWWLKANYQNIRNLAGGDLRDGLNLELVGSIRCPLCSCDEQVKIYEYLDKETSIIDRLIDKAGKSIDLAKEHRSALISAAVTGKIDVREAA